MEKKDRFNNLEEIPTWAENTIKKLIDKNIFADTNNLDLSLDMIRVLVVNDRLGIY